MAFMGWGDQSKPASIPLLARLPPLLLVSSLGAVPLWQENNEMVPNKPEASGTSGVSENKLHSGKCLRFACFTFEHDFCPCSYHPL
jgi:hypothetical protein